MKKNQNKPNPQDHTQKPHHHETPEEKIGKKERFKPSDARTNPEGLAHEAEEYKQKKSNKID